MSDLRQQQLVTEIANEVQARGRKHASGEPLFFDRHNLERAISDALVRAASQPTQQQADEALFDEIIGLLEREQEVRSGNVNRGLAEAVKVIQRIKRDWVSAVRAASPPALPEQKLKDAMVFGQMRGAWTQDQAWAAWKVQERELDESRSPDGDGQDADSCRGAQRAAPSAAFTTRQAGSEPADSHTTSGGVRSAGPPQEKA